MAPNEPAEQSRAPPGDLAAEPENPRYVTVTDSDGNTHGFLGHWGADEWIYATEETTELYDDYE